MSDVSPSSERRAQLTALTGLLVQVGLFIFASCAVILSPQRPAAAFSAAVHILVGLLIWIILLTIFSLRRRSRLEDLETEQLRRARDEGRATNIFEVGDESLLLERRRLAWTYKFLVPIITVLIALKLIAAYFFESGYVAAKIAEAEKSADEATLVPMLFMAGTAFCAFIYSRYIVGMARQPEWRLLRAGGSFLIGNAITCTIVALALALSQSKALAPWVEPLADDIVRTIMLILGIEVVVNLILEMYRPRRAGEEVRPAFDSRILGLFSEPGGIVRSVAETVNYQFGFEVSGTWFYKLLQRSVLPLAALTLVSLIALSCVVIVDVDEAGYIEHFGSVDAKKQIGPGLHFKMPWPIDSVMRERVDQVRFLTIGEGSEDDGHAHGENEAILWTEEHEFNAEILTVVANPEMDQLSVDSSDSDGGKRSRSVAVSLLMTSVVIEYKIKDLHAYSYNYADPDKVLESIAHQELSDYAAGVDLAALMGRGRQAFGPSMKKVLQRRCDENELGIDITFVALQEAHPPSQSDVAKAFQDVVAAEMRKTAAIEQAHGNAQQMLTTVAGSVERSEEIDEAIQKLNRLNSEHEKSPSAGSEAAVATAKKRLDQLLFGDESKGIAPASGRVAAMLATARATRASVISEAESKARSFKYDVVAFRAAPDLFMVRRWLDALSVELPRMRKYIFVGDKANRDNVIIEWDGKEAGTLDLSEPELGK